MKVWPVIHVKTVGGMELARYNFLLAAKNECDGVLFISMDGNDQITEIIARDFIGNIYGLKIGINFLRQSPSFSLAASVSNGFDATWSDSPGAQAGIPLPESRLLSRHLPTGHLFFSGVAFKGQDRDVAPRQSAEEIAKLGLIPTTSGPGTGMAPDLKKMHAFNFPNKMERLAIASGLTPDNVAMFKPYASHALVATGISRTFHEFDPVLLRRFMEAAR